MRFEAIERGVKPCKLKPHLALRRNFAGRFGRSKNRRRGVQGKQRL